MSTDWSGDDDPEIGARSLTLCRQVEFDAAHPDSPYTLRGVLSVYHMRTGLPGIWRGLCGRTSSSSVAPVTTRSGLI